MTSSTHTYIHTHTVLVQRAELSIEGGIVLDWMEEAGDEGEGGRSVL